MRVWDRAGGATLLKEGGRKGEGLFQKGKKGAFVFLVQNSKVICNVNICLLVIPLGDRLLLGDQIY